MEKNKILEALILHYSEGNKAGFARKLGVMPQTINTWEKRNSFDIELIYAKCEDVSGDWLLSGEGEMLRSKRNAAAIAAGADRHLFELCRRLIQIYEQKDSTIVELISVIKNMETT